MRKVVLAAAMASTCLATPAFAREGAVYIELNGGVLKANDIEFDVGAVGNAVDIDHDYGFDAGAIIGYDFGAFRIEAEGSYREAEIDKANLAGFAPTFDAVGDTSALSFMGNALADFGPDDGLQFYAGGGVGYSRVSVDSRTVVGGIDDHDWGFAWQLLGGVRAPLNDNIDVGVKYRFFNQSNVELAGGLDDGRFRSHSLMGTIGYNFGGAERMPEVLPPPPPPPPPPPAPVYTPPPPPPPPPAYTPPPPMMGERG